MQKVLDHRPAWTEDQKSFLSSPVPICVTVVSLPLDSVSSGFALVSHSLKYWFFASFLQKGAKPETQLAIIL